MMEKNIYGVLRGGSLSKPLIIFVHGLSGYKNEHIYYNGSRFFEKHGYLHSDLTFMGIKKTLENSRIVHCQSMQRI